MTAHYRILPAADRDLDDQAAYLASQASLETALRFYDAASSTFAKLADMPVRVIKIIDAPSITIIDGNLVIGRSEYRWPLLCPVLLVIMSPVM
jgi:ParE toxin of type II toxin-antitoxin system, parDE